MMDRQADLSFPKSLFLTAMYTTLHVLYAVIPPKPESLLGIFYKCLVIQPKLSK